MSNGKMASPPFNPYEHPHHFVRHVITTLLLVSLAFVGGLYFSGVGLFSPFDNMESSKKGSYEEGYQAAMDFAQERLSEEGVADKLPTQDKKAEEEKGLANPEFAEEPLGSDLPAGQVIQGEKEGLVNPEFAEEPESLGSDLSAEQVRQDEKVKDQEEAIDENNLSFDELDELLSEQLSENPPTVAGGLSETLSVGGVVASPTPDFTEDISSEELLEEAADFKR